MNENMFSYIGFGIVLLGFGMTLYFLLMHLKVIKRSPATKWIENSLRVIGTVIFFLTPFRIFRSEVLKERAKYRCRHCGFLDNVDSEYCPNCGCNDEGRREDELMSYQCTFCRRTTQGNHAHCPSCGLDPKGEYKVSAWK